MAFALTLLSSICIETSYFRYLPRLPDENFGRTNRIVVSHGSVRYGSEREIQLLGSINKFAPFAGILFLAALAFGIKSGDFHVKKGWNIW